MRSVLIYLVLIGLCVLAFLRWGPAYSQTREYSPLGDAVSDFRANMVREAKEAHKGHTEPPSRLVCEKRFCKPIVETETTVTVTYETDYGLWTVNYGISP